MHNWQWLTWEEKPYLTCDLLQPWQHGFFTQQCHPHQPEVLVTALQAEVPVYRVKQVHGNQVLRTQDLQSLAAIADTVLHPEADGLFTERAHQSIWVCSADCTPVLIADEGTGQVAAIHSGWRGTASKIVPEAVQCLLRQGSRIADLRVALGPAIAGEVYQVSLEVAAQVGASVIPFDSDKVEVVLDALQDFPNPPVSPDPEPGRARLDVRRTIALQLEQLGFSPEQVAIAPYCTYQQPNYFFSYRRDRQKLVQWSGIVSR